MKTDRVERKSRRRVVRSPLPTCIPHMGLIYRSVGSHNSMIERIISRHREETVAILLRPSNAFNAYCIVTWMSGNSCTFCSCYAGSFNDFKRCYNRSDAMLSGLNGGRNVEKSVFLRQINGLIQINVLLVNCRSVGISTNDQLVSLHCKWLTLFWIMLYDFI